MKVSFQGDQQGQINSSQQFLVAGNESPTARTLDQSKYYKALLFPLTVLGLVLESP